MKLPWQRKTGEDGSEHVEVSLPDDVKAKLEGAASKDELTALGTKFDELRTSLESINAHFSRETEERKAAATRKAAEEANAAGARTEEELNEDFLTNPVGTIRKLMNASMTPTNQALLMTRAENLRRSTFEDSEKFPFYSGELKSEIDKLLTGQDLKAQNDPSVIEHAYYSTIGKHHKDLLDGKLKSRFASSEGTRGTSTGDTSGTGTEKRTPQPLDDDGKRVAKMLGYSDTEYSKMLFDEGVGVV